SVADVAAPLLDALGPGVEFEFAVEVDVAASEPDALAVDAREIGLAADPAAVAAIQRVIPSVQLPDGRRVHGGNEIASIVSNVDEVFVGPDAVHRRNNVVRQFARRTDIEAPAAVREADHTPLRFGPAEDRQVPRRPILDDFGNPLVRPDVILLAQ